MSDKDFSDDEGWTEAKSKNRKHRSSLTTPRSRLTSSSIPPTDLRTKKISKIGNISTWMCYIIDGNIVNLIKEKLSSLNENVCGDILNLWDCLFYQLNRIIDITNGFDNPLLLKQYVYESLCGGSCLENQNHEALEAFSEEYKIKVKFTSIDKNSTEIIYGENFLSTMYILHIGLDLFLPLEASGSRKEYKPNLEDQRKIKMAIQCDKKVNSNLKSVQDNNRLKELRKLLKGLETVQSPVPINKLQAKLEYDTYTPDELEKMDDLILCELKIIGAHSGIAIPIKTQSVKYEEIKLLNRRNCGYNAFDGDIVRVKINDPKIPTGKVVDVYESYHKPINSIYVCKVNRDQGSLMTPLDSTFPKIHVDNQHGHRQYESEIQKREKSFLKDEQKSVVERGKESFKYADNLYYSLFDVSVNENKLHFQFKSVEKFDPHTCDNYFIVCYERWDPQYMYPYGKVVGILNGRDTLEENFELISSICNIESVNLTAQYEKEVQEIIGKVKLLNESEDYIPSDAVVFTIDSKNTKDIDDAISYHKEGNDTVIGIHISDVTKYISSTHEIYYQAQRRFCTIYPPYKKPIHLIDERLSTDALSLIPNVPRAVVSVFFRFPSNVTTDFKITDLKFREGVIVSKHKLTYEEVSKWLKQNQVPENVDPNLFEALKNSFEISKNLRQARLPKSYFVRSTNKFVKDLYVDNQFEAETLVNEFMLLANENVAKKVYYKYPDSTLLRIQNSVRNYENWLDSLLQSTNMNFEGELNDYCSLLEVKNADFPVKKNILVSRKFFERFISLIKKDADSAKNLLLYDIYYNEFMVHIIDWYKINCPARYECSYKNSVNNKHFSLNKDLYTNFTSPIRRFSDIVVHRLLKSVINGKMIDDSSLDIHYVCSIANQKYKSNDRFEEICASYTVFEDNKTFCFILDCTCSEINEDGIVVAHHLLQKSLSLKTMKFSYLTLSDLPFFKEEKTDNCTLKWRRIIYSCSTSNIENNTDSTGTFVIDKDLYNVSLSSEASKEFGAIRRSCTHGQTLKEKLQNFKSKFIVSKYNTLISSDLYSIFNPIIDIQLQVFVKSTMRIQFSKNKVHGLPKITPELYIVTPTFQICLIHQDDPVRFFVQDGKLKLKYNINKTRFTTIAEYKEYFEPLIHAESLEETLSGDISFTLLSVQIKWILKVYSPNGKKVRYGVIMLPEKFCQEKNIHFSDEKSDIINRYEHLIDEELSPIGSDLLCLRFKCASWNNYWIGHGEVVHASKFQQENTIYKIIIFLLTHSDFDAFSTIQDKNTYSVDVYNKSVVTRRQQLLMKSLEENELVCDIIMGKDLSIDNIDCGTLVTEKMFSFNKSQKQAMIRALKHKFSLIWGPPGTGKTFIGCCLSFEYTQRNLSTENVVLYCGPSNDCVDLVANYLRKQFNESCPKLLRIYSKQQELTDFPVPGYFVRNCQPLSDEMKPFSLHFLIRKEGNFVDLLRVCDEKFRSILQSKKCNPEERLHDLIQNYKGLLLKAKRDYVSKVKYDIVLCTTSVTATKIMKSFNITQVIVDEAGMCKEPETLIPISKMENSIKNIVLIGDHKQLRPIILSRLAESHGLQISLFERYQNLPNGVVTLLNFQYRMHPSICEFPSKEFYSSKLKTQASILWSGLTANDLRVEQDYYDNEWNGLDSFNLAGFEFDELRRKSNYLVIKDEKWPRRDDKPYNCFDRKFSWYPERTIFIDIIGTEVAQSVTTSTGNENSKGNKTEVEVCGYIYRRLIESGAQARSISILTQYKLQQHLLKLNCQDILKSKKIMSDPIVKTVIRSQGSENDYIIFSTVRSLTNKNDINTHPTQGWERQYLGFITDPHQINVALTRAKKGLIIVGNRQLLQVNETWKKIINNYSERNCIVNNYLNFI